nr:zinc finger BED domain-containing protein RICESLEEPER 2 [Tanacetum cinerariifolium]
MHPHCEALKTVSKAVQSSISRDGSVFVYNPDAVREQFAGLAIQEGLPFNHFDNTRMTRVFQEGLSSIFGPMSLQVLMCWVFESGQVLSIRRTRLTPTSLEMCMCLNDHLDAQDRIQNTSSLEHSLDFEEDILEEEVQDNEAIPLSDEEIALDEATSEAMSSSGGEDVDLTLSESD